MNTGTKIPGAGRSPGIFFAGENGGALSTALSVSLLLHLVMLTIQFPPLVVPGHGPERIQARINIHTTGSIAPLTQSSTENGKSVPATIVGPVRPQHTNTEDEKNREIKERKDQEKIFTADSLDVKPAIKTRTMPEYPETLPKGASGTVILELVITSTGRVALVSTTKTSGYLQMDESAVFAFMHAEFTPGYYGNAPVASRIQISVTFDGN